MADDDPQKGGEAVLNLSGPEVSGSEAVQGPAQGSKAVQGGAEDPQVGGDDVQGPSSPADGDEAVQGGRRFIQGCGEARSLYTTWRNHPGFRGEVSTRSLLYACRLLRGGHFGLPESSQG